MGAPTSEIGYTSAITRRGDHKVYREMCGIGEREREREREREGGNRKYVVSSIQLSFFSRVNSVNLIALNQPLMGQYVVLYVSVFDIQQKST
jgi:hypothetical protein